LSWLSFSPGSWRRDQFSVAVLAVPADSWTAQELFQMGTLYAVTGSAAKELCRQLSFLYPSTNRGWAHMQEDRDIAHCQPFRLASSSWAFHSFGYQVALVSGR
jgi:hypothetical protein